MRGHDQTSRRLRSGAWRGPWLAAALALAAAGAARAQDGPAAPAAAPAARTREPIDLAARRVHVWEQDGQRWAHLAGRAAVLQGVDGVRADEALVRIVATPVVGGGTSYRLDVYAEASPAPNAPRRPVRATLATERDVRLKPYEAGGLVRLKQPPDLPRWPLFARSGLGARPENDAPRTAAYVVSKAAPAQPASALPQFQPVPDETPPADPGRVVLPLTPAPAPPRRGNANDPKVDRQVQRTRAQSPDDPGGGVVEPPPPVEPDPPGGVSPLDDVPPGPDMPEPPEMPGGDDADKPSDAEALPGPGGGPAPALRPEGGRRAPAPPTTPILPGSQRVTRVYPRNGGTPFEVQRLPVANGVETVVIRGGVNIVTESPQFGVIDLSADSVIVWRRVGPDGAGTRIGPNGEEIDDARIPMEFYLEGDVVVRQDERKVAGNGDQKTFRAKRAYFDVLSERFVGVEGELDMFAPGLIAPAKIVAPRIEQFRPIVTGPDGRPALGLAEMRADQVMGTGSRFPRPGYRFTSRSVDVFRVRTEETEPNSGRRVAAPGDPNPPEDLSWRLDSRQNVFWLGRLPVFYWPRFVAEANDLEPPLRQITFRTNNYFGQQLLTDWNGFRVFGLRKPLNVDMWNLDLDYLSARTKTFPALGSEIGWFGRDLINDLSDPYGRRKGKAPSFTNDYFGYFDIWGLQDAGRDTLGSGPAIITNNRAAGNVGYQRGGGGPLGAVPPFQNPRGRLVFRHMQRFLPDDDEHLYEDFRAQLEVGYSTDRYFLEEYYKRLFDVGMDQETLAYVIKQKQNHAVTAWAEANLQGWYTDTQWLPRFDDYLLGQSLLGNRLTYFEHSGFDYANTHTASEVNNPYIFAFMPYDPISNTSTNLSAFRGYTNHELDLPLNFNNMFRLVPYVQGQAVGWSNQINGSSMGRLWGAAGARAEVMAWKIYPWAQSEFLNVHGINHKINLEADFRAAYANQHLDYIGVQDDLDDNTYESTRRYFALTNYAGGLLPPQYDPRHLILRRTISPITGTTDIQNSLTTLHVGLHQRLQTKRGPEGRRRVMDWMTLDLDTTFFPDPSRDNFGKPFGQNMYNWQWFIGDRTSLQSTGWFEFWNITGNPIYKTNVDGHNNPFGLNVITSGVNLNRPPRGNIFIGYSVINTGPINTSALNFSTSYWLSPKWYGSYSSMYDFGNAILLAASFSLTRIGADWLTSLGLTVDPQRQSYMFAIMLSPRLSPNVKLGNAVGLNQFDARFAPNQ